MAGIQDILTEIELHSVEGIRHCFASGISPNDIHNNEPLIYELTSEYTRSPRFKDCVKTFIEHGLTFEDKPLLAVLSDDAEALNKMLAKEPGIVHRRYSMRCAYTSLHEVTLLHICAEFNHVDCASVLVDHGADINARAGVDEFGYGGQTTIFHTVNQNNNQSAGMMHFLLSKSADCAITIRGLIWGKGYEWETFIPAVNPISYAIMGLLPQMHRSEKTISETVTLLMRHEFGIDYKPGNFPNKYLKK